MTDLIGRLSARASGARPLSRPRPMSRFTAGADLTEVVEEVRVPPSTHVPTPARPVTPPEPPPVVLPPTPSPERPVVVHHHETRHVAPVPPNTSTTVIRQSSPRTEVRVVRPPAPAEPRPAAPVVEARTVVETRSERTRTVVDRTRERTTHQVIRSTVEHRDTVHVRDAEPQRPTATPATTPPQALPPLRPPARTEEVVRISIGRVDIRAGLVAPEPVKHKPEPAVDRTISLADYLRGAHG